MENIVAIYTRLSEEDRNKLSKEEESRSIQNQKSMLFSYAMQRGWEIYNIYSDDDYKGSDRNRPAFNQLLKDAEARKFNIVLCKSQARFTRELEMVERIIHGQFVEWGIRFVGYADNADTANKGNKKSRQINGLVNEWYLEDLSDNIKTVLTDRRKKGIFIGAFAPYGYQKDPDQKGHLIPDPEAAAVVRKIFELYVAGYGRTAIARHLNAKGIPNPTAYKREKGMRYSNPHKKFDGIWKYAPVRDILINEVYIGNLIQGKYESPSYKSLHCKPVPKERWIRVNNTHEPIISQELWEKAKEIEKQRTKPMGGKITNKFAGKARCMYCEYTLASCKNHNYYYLRCSSRHFDKTKCKGAFISQRLLDKIILQELNQMIEQYFDENAAESRICLQNNNEAKRKSLLKKREQYTDKICELKKATENMYLDKVKNVITEAQFIEFSESFTNEIYEAQERIQEIDKEIELLAQRIKSNKSVGEILKKYRNLQELDRETINTLIDYIEVGRLDRRAYKDEAPPIAIHWKF